MNIVSKKTTYEFTLDDVKKLFSEALDVSVDRIKVRYIIEEVGGDPMDRFRGTDEVTRIEVTVDNKKNGE